MEVRIRLADQVLSRFGNQLGALGDGLARTVMARALNHEGDKGRTQVKHALVRQTGIKYGMINSAMKTIRASKSTLTYILEARGDETNLNLFGARDGSQRGSNIKGAKVLVAKSFMKSKRGVSSAPWAKRQIFKHSFMIPAYGNRVYVRTGERRFPLKPLYGPNIARELVKGSTAATFKDGSANIADRVAHEIARVLPG